MEVPKWLKAYLNHEDLLKIEQKIIEIEKQTSGEIVPVIARRSTTSGHVPYVLAAVLAILILSFDFLSWQLDYLLWPRTYILILNTLIFIGLLITLSHKAFILRLFTPSKDMTIQVNRRALNEFYNKRVHHTQRSTGILIFVSLDEHRALVIGDDLISEKLNSEDWQEVVQLLLNGIKSKKMAQGFLDAIERAGELLKNNFPAEKNNANELENHLIILDE